MALDLDFGINGSTSVQAARPITVNSTTALGVLGVATTNIGLHKFNNAEAALFFLDEESVVGDIVHALKGIALQGVNCPIILNLCASNNEVDVLPALDLFKKSEGLTGVSLMGGFILAPLLSESLTVASKLDAVASAINATALIDNFGADEAAVLTFASNFGSQHSLLCHGLYVADGVDVSASALLAGVFAYWDSKPFGWAKSHSNRVVKGVSGVAATGRVVEYLDGSDSEARRMRQNGVATILRDVGWRSFGFETTDIDPVWQSLDRVRTFQRLLSAITLSSKWARDREANELIWVKQSIVDFMNELKGNDVIVGF